MRIVLPSEKILSALKGARRRQIEKAPAVIYLPVFVAASRMSALGQKQTFWPSIAMSAFLRPHH
jgi:hypothetical protein